MHNTNENKITVDIKSFKKNCSFCQEEAYQLHPIIKQL